MRSKVLLAIIPARSGSKGVSLKNIRPIGGKSLLERAINSASDRRIADVVVSTDSIEFRDLAIQSGAYCPSLRSKELSSDTAKTVDVISAVVGEYEKLKKVEVDTIMLLEPTSPFRSSIHVSRAIDLWLSIDSESLVSVCRLERKPQNIFVKQEYGTLRQYIQEPREYFYTRQSMERLVRINSAIYIVKKSAFYENRSLVGSEPLYFEMDEVDSLNVDTELDLMFCQFLEQLRVRS
jgi:CMP-N,N'-diacetyllegionaminic acid synthase